MSIDLRSSFNRRDFLYKAGMGFGAVGLAALLGPQRLDAAGEVPHLINPFSPKAPHFPGKAKHVIHLFMNGGPSHVDTFDPKPLLQKYAGKELPNPLKTERRTGTAFPSPFKFQRHGKSGIEVSEIFPEVGSCIDDIAVIRSMHADVPNHQPSILLMNCGEARLVRPSLGSWITYGLGTENQNLPAFVAMCPGGVPDSGAQNWTSGFLGGIYQGTHVDTGHAELEKLVENIRNHAVPRAEQRQQLDLLAQLNHEHQRTRDRNEKLDARVQSFELAYRMQMEASEAFDISREPASVRKMYGDSVQARQLLIARRLVERGVRVVQVWHAAGAVWDHHDDLELRHREHASLCDRPIAALLRDLKQRGLLDETLVVWSGEFGRTPTVELPAPAVNMGKLNGRDHNHHGFSAWMAGGGVKGGYVHGATDEFGFKATDKPVHVHDLHATILHLLGFDHEKLTFRHAGRDFRLTDVHGNVVRELIA